MEFWKMNGAGNDFIVISNFDGKYDGTDWSRLASVVCERHLSIGADGLMVVEKPEDGGDYKMLFFNSDGSSAEMCGNGARCICRFGFEHGFAGDVQIVETTAGKVRGERLSESRYRVKLNDPEIIRLNQATDIDGKTYSYDYIELGNPGVPHMCVEIENLREFPVDELRALGSMLRFCKDLPKGANVNFYEMTGENTAYEKTFERGVEDFTYACGTGTASSAISMYLHEKSGKVCDIDMAGGRLTVEVDADCENVRSVYLTGPTNVVCKGVITDENLK